jgi:hypothetical protein
MPKRTPKYGNLEEKTIDERLAAVTASTSRARRSFLIMTIFCAAINIALWNGYLSWIRDMAMPKLEETAKEEAECRYFCNIRPLGYLIEKAKKHSKTKQDPDTKPPVMEKGEWITLDCSGPIPTGQQVTNATAATKADPGQNANRSMLNCNGILLSAQGVTAAERNRNKLVEDWVTSQTISVNLLGIRLTTFDLAILGSVSLIIIMIWHFFVVRRENRTIVPFLKETCRDTLPWGSSDVQKDLANLVFVGIANNTVFIDIADNDNPSRLTFDEKGRSKLSFERGTINTSISLLFAMIFAIFCLIIWLAQWLLEWYETILCVLGLAFVALVMVFFKRSIERSIILGILRRRKKKLILARRQQRAYLQKEKKIADRPGSMLAEPENEPYRKSLKKLKTRIKKMEAEKKVAGGTFFARVLNRLKELWEKLRNKKNEAFVSRWLLDLLMFLPGITIFLIFLSDISSLFNYSAYRVPDKLLLEIILNDDSPNVIWKIAIFESVAILAFLMTVYLSIRCMKFVSANSESLNAFYKQYIKSNNERGE